MTVGRPRSGHCFGAAVIAEEAPLAIAIASRQPGEWMPKIRPVIMCGGSGTRMWPESRESLPKQFIPLIGQRSTFQTIVSVVSDPAVFDPAVVITNFDYRFRVAEQLREIGAEATSCSSRTGATARRPSAPRPRGRPRSDPKAVVAVLAADHVFEDGKQFAALCAQAYAAAAVGRNRHLRRHARPSRHRLRLHPSGRAARA